jgi:hypothetical protein
MVGSMGSEQRLQIIAALILGASTAAEVRAKTGLDMRTVQRDLDRLVASGVAVEEEGRFVVRTTDLAEAARHVAKASASAADVGPAVTPGERVRRAFLKDGKLTSIPSQRSKRRVVLDVLAQEFEPGRRYPEREVNRRLRRWHQDAASLRRYLVDEGYMELDHGEYWRTGGTFELG